MTGIDRGDRGPVVDADPDAPARPGPRLVLASGSAARLELLRRAGFDPEVRVSQVPEDVEATETAEAVAILARRKGVAVAPHCPDAVVIACDSMVDLGGRPVGKPASAAAVLEYWRRLAGSRAVLHTGHWVADTRTGRWTSGVAGTTVRFGSPSEDELAAYIATGEPLQLAGGFSIDGYGGPFIEGIDGDPSNVLGLSLPLFRRMLARLDLALTDFWAPVSPSLPPPGAATPTA